MFNCTCTWQLYMCVLFRSSLLSCWNCIDKLLQKNAGKLVLCMKTCKYDANYTDYILQTLIYSITYIIMLNKNSQELIKKGTAKQSTIKNIVKLKGSASG